MNQKEAIPFTRIDQPVKLIEPEIELPKGSNGADTGCCAVDLKFQCPSQIGEIVFKNYYSAWISVYVKRIPNSKGKDVNNDITNNPRNNQKNRNQLLRSFSIDASSCSSKRISPTRQGAIDLLPDEDNVEGKQINRRRHSSGPQIDLLERPWELSISTKSLMPYPHYESGSQDFVSISVTESLVDWNEIIIMRFVLYQPSKVWKKFSIDEIIVFQRTIKNKTTLFSNKMNYFDEIQRQKEKMAILKSNTKAMLTGHLVEAELVDN